MRRERRERPPFHACHPSARRPSRRPRNSKARFVHQKLLSSRESRPARGYHTSHRRPEFPLILTQRLFAGIRNPMRKPPIKMLGPSPVNSVRMILIAVHHGHQGKVLGEEPRDELNAMLAR